MTWTHPLSARVEQGPELLGGKAHGLLTLRRLGLPVPAGFVVTTEASRAFRHGGRLPDGARDEIATAVSALEAETGRRFGDTHDPLTVSVRSGAGVSMPGMMTTILNLELPTTDPGVAEDPLGGLYRAIAEVFSSWDTPRARTYRALHGVPDDLGTAVTVQAMVFGDRDARSGSGVAFTHDPNTGEHVPFGEVLFGRQGDAVVSGSALTSPLRALADREPAVWADLVAALDRVSEHHRDACYVEFTYESGRLWMLQLRPARLVGAAAVRVAVDLAEAGVISRAEALLRVPPPHLRHARTARAVLPDGRPPLARGVGACPGVAVGRVVTNADRAVSMAARGPVVLFRPETSPLDMRGLAASAGIVTARGGPASHAAVVARSMGTPAVVGVEDLTVEPDGIRVGDRHVPEGALVTVDGTGGELALGRVRVTSGEGSPQLGRLLAWADEVAGRPGGGSCPGMETGPEAEEARLRAAHTALRG
ncbi:PEP/pyruvate-binding domain-containing protein [Nocardiopsis sp. L17-MgMaSL7]|uniref:PEP/pyruvate-binding domain-containing protein n=1 Tax=Nocardiopsis sp. L17-MgMaSL7 TaxID=1938893 RepID=UPI000D709B8A|nr:PEP/pyruvate-binding domain-containing protein [Nocardiopsis sp. L17-MgMaSL7]PWV58146.1 pyruvate,orthophosphate dikinase [Nocardiopsis sp. L17-MgMaSL7]